MRMLYPPERVNEESAICRRPELLEGFGMWKLSNFNEHEKVLGSKTGPDHLARETLGAYGNHRIRLIQE